MSYGFGEIDAGYMFSWGFLCIIMHFATAFYRKYIGIRGKNAYVSRKIQFVKQRQLNGIHKTVGFHLISSL